MPNDNRVRASVRVRYDFAPAKSKLARRNPSDTLSTSHNFADVRKDRSTNQQSDDEGDSALRASWLRGGLNRRTAHGLVLISGASRRRIEPVSRMDPGYSDHHFCVANHTRRSSREEYWR